MSAFDEGGEYLGQTWTSEVGDSPPDKGLEPHHSSLYCMTTAISRSSEPVTHGYMPRFQSSRASLRFLYVTCKSLLGSSLKAGAVRKLDSA